MNDNEIIACDILDVAMDIIAQRRKDKDIPHLPSGNDKSKLRDDRKKPKGLDKSDPDSKDTKKDPDLKSGAIEVARSLVAMARELVSEN